MKKESPGVDSESEWAYLDLLGIHAHTNCYHCKIGYKNCIKKKNNILDKWLEKERKL